MLCPIQTQIAQGQEQAWFQAPSSTRGIFPSLKTLFQGSAAGARGRALRGGEFSQNHLDLGEKKNKQFSELLMVSKVCPGLPGSAALGFGSWVRFQPFCNESRPHPGCGCGFLPAVPGARCSTRGRAAPSSGDRIAPCPRGGDARSPDAASWWQRGSCWGFLCRNILALCGLGTGSRSQGLDGARLGV